MAMRMNGEVLYFWYTKSVNNRCYHDPRIKSAKQVVNNDRFMQIQRNRKTDRRINTVDVDMFYL